MPFSSEDNSLRVTSLLNYLDLSLTQNIMLSPHFKTYNDDNGMAKLLRKAHYFLFIENTKMQNAWKSTYCYIFGLNMKEEKNAKTFTMTTEESLKHEN